MHVYTSGLKVPESKTNGQNKIKAHTWKCYEHLPFLSYQDQPKASGCHGNRGRHEGQRSRHTLANLGAQQLSSADHPDNRRCADP